MSGPKRPLTQQEKDRIIYLASNQLPISEIAKEINVDPRRVTGYIRTMINSGRLASNALVPSPAPETVSMGTTQTPAQAPVQPQTQPPAPASAVAAPAAAPMPAYIQPPADAWVGGRPVMSSVAGFQNPTAQVRMVIERKIPNDGILGEHFGEITRERLCEIYGEGLYKVLRYEPGKPLPVEYEFQASAAFGPPRTPKRTIGMGEQARTGYNRPWMNGGSRPWERSYGSERYEGREEDDGRPVPARPFYNRPDSSASDFARHNPMADVAAAATTEAIKQIGALNERTIDQLEKSRNTTPDHFVANFGEEQQTNWERRMQEDERRRADERREENEKWERRQKELEAEHRRRQEEGRQAHERELERIKAETTSRETTAREERKSLMELEDRKLQVIRDEHKMRQEALQEELKRNREELKSALEHTETERKETLDKTEKKLQEIQSATSSQIAESNERLEKELERKSETLEREYKLKEKALDQRNALEQQIIDIKKDSIANTGGDQIFQTINTVVKEFSKNLEKIVDLKKLEAMTPEAQAAAVAKGTIDGNVMGEPRREAREERAQTQAPPPPNATPPPNTQAPKNNGNASGPSGEAAKGDQKNEESKMEQVIQDMLDKPFFRQVIKEWSLHVKTNQDPTTFANMYMEWMRDPLDHEGRKATTMFANFMKPRDWTDMMKILGPKLDKDVQKIFQSEAASDFFEGFKAMVVEQIRDYWEQFLESRKAARAARTAAGEAPAADAPAEAPEEGNKQ